MVDGSTGRYAGGEREGLQVCPRPVASGRDEAGGPSKAAPAGNASIPPDSRRRFSRRAVLAGLLALPVSVVGASMAAEQVGGIGLYPGQNGARFTAAGRAGVVGLTFDDGPDLAYTPDVLDILAAHQATATFFVIGNRVDRHPELCHRALAAGHELANHSASHPHLDLGSHRRVVEEVEGGASALRRLGVEPRYFRPPYGRATEDVRDVVDRAGLEPGRCSARRRRRQTCPRSTN